MLVSPHISVPALGFSITILTLLASCSDASSSERHDRDAEIIYRRIEEGYP